MPTPEVTFVEIVPNAKSSRKPKDSMLSQRSMVVAISYWSIVLPLTLISAFLLLSKPRKSTQKKLTEPIQVEGT